MKLISSINNYKTDLLGWIASIIMLGFACIATYRWYTTGLVFYGLLIIRDLAASWFLLSRNSIKNKTGLKFNSLIAYVSCVLPFIYLDSENSLIHAGLICSILAIVGFTISTMALLDLSGSFGISPANRGVVKTGLYRYIRHPIYLGYIISELGFIFINPINIIIWIFSVGFYFFRARVEDKILNYENKC